MKFEHQKSWNWLRHPFYSVFTKLIAVILISGSLLVFGIFSIGREGFKEFRGNFFSNNLAQYGMYLVRDLEENLNLEYARDLSERLFLIIRFEGGNDTWQTSSGIPPLEKVRFRKWINKSTNNTDYINKINYETVSNVMVGRYKGQGVVRVDTMKGRFIFAELDDEWRETRFLLPWIIAVLGLIGLILAGTWLALRWIMKPLNWLSDGVYALGEGDLEHRLPEKRRDELGNLARAFNRMSESIREMLTAREQLLLDVSHELRSPLTRMKVALEFIPENSSQDSLQSDVQEMEQMVTEILETARLKSEYGKLDRMDTDLVTLIEKTCLIFEGKPPGISFENSVEKCVANVDVEQIQTVLKNILANAHKYSTPENEPIKVCLSRDDSGIQLEIQDYGQGIPDEEMDLIFEPFYRVDKSRNKKTGGYGLGLSLCKTIIEAHGGTIFVKSSMGKGTIFSLLLPNTSSTI